MENIQHFWQKIKNLAEDGVGEWGLVAIIFLLALSSFGLGRLSVYEEPNQPVAVAHSAKTAEPAGMYPGGLFVASRSGSVYYFPWCSGAQKILPANQVWFASEEAALRAGYGPSKACKGLTN